MSEFSNERLLSVIRELLPQIELTGKVEQLSGGNINFVWRADGTGRNLIIKHAPPYIATDPSVPLSDERIDFEARMIKKLDNGGSLQKVSRPEIRPPKLYAYDPERSLLIMEDVGDFQELQAASGSSEIMGKRLGQFIGNLHRSTFQDNEIAKSFHNIEIQKVRNQLQYQPAWEYLNIQDKELETEIRKKSRDLGDRLLKRGKCLTMGDLWPPSVFVSDDEYEIRLIDWEFVHFGRPLQDIGHFAAHCWMQEQVAKLIHKKEWWNQLWNAFLKSYKNTTGPLYEKLMDDQDLNDIGIHIGTEILIRTRGPFKNNYIYRSFKKENSILKEADKFAISAILESSFVQETFRI